MFGLSIEHLIVIAVVLLLFGARRLPELGSSVGQALKNLKRSVSPDELEHSADARENAASDQNNKSRTLP